MSEMLEAITHQDEEDLSRLLSSGWEPARLLAKTVTVPDLTAWTEVVLRDWSAGLKLLDTHFPEITRRPDVWRIALRTASSKCLEYLWGVLGYEVDNFSPALRQDCVVALASAMGEPWSPSYEIRDIQPVLRLFRAKGVLLDGVVPGEFEPGDLRSAGHSLFTRAVATRRWDVAQVLWPETDKPLPSWPRLDEVLLGVLDSVGGDYRPLMVSSFIEARAALLPLPFRQLSFKPGLFQQAGILDDRFLFDWLSSFHDVWPPNRYEVIDAMALPSKDYIAPWLRLPLLVESVSFGGLPAPTAPSLPSISPELDPVRFRKLLWKVWSRVLSGDASQSWLRALARDPNDSEVVRLVALLKEEAPEMMEIYWDQLSSIDGFSPAQIWDMHLDVGHDVLRSNHG